MRGKISGESRLDKQYGKLQRKSTARLFYIPAVEIISVVVIVKLVATVMKKIDFFFHFPVIELNEQHVFGCLCVCVCV